MDFLRSSTRVYQFRVKPVARCLAKKKREEIKNARSYASLEMLNCKIYGVRKSQRSQVYKINPDARSRFTALRRLSVLRARENLINVTDVIKASFDYHR